MVREVCAAADVAAAIAAAAAAAVVRSSQPVSNTPVSITLPSRSPWRSPVCVRGGHFFAHRGVPPVVFLPFRGYI
jgi:hypothetical protein